MSKFIGNDISLGRDTTGRNIIVPHDRRLEHLAIFGVTGTGKSRGALENIVRQDINNWSRTRCGMLVIDPHGDVVNGIMQYVAANKLFHLPIIPVDLSSQENIISYNPLRPRKTEPSVVIDSFVQATAHVWGQARTDETPLFERIATNILWRLYHEGRTLADAAHLFTRDGAVLTEHIHDPLIRRDWLAAQTNWKGFETDSMSTVNRFRRFLLNPTLRAMFAQRSNSLDFGKALDEGHIILVSLAREGGLVSEENGNLLATLFLADLWASAAERGKRENIRPFYCILDETERFLSPTLAQNLAEARGFKIGMTMACQHPQQFLARGETGPRLFHEVMENARTKMIFRLSSKANLEPVAEQLCMRSLDPYKLKFQHHQLTTVGHEIRYLDAYGRTSTVTVGGGKNCSDTHTAGRTSTATWSHTDQNNWSDTHTDTKALGTGTTENENWNEGDSVSANQTIQTSEMAGANRTLTKNATQTDTETFGITGRELQEDGNTNFKEHFDEDKLPQSWQVGHAASAGTAEANGTQQQRGLALSKGNATTAQRGKGGGRALSTQANTGTSDAHAVGASSADTFGNSESDSESDASMVGGNSNWSNAEGNTVTSSPHLIPILEYEPAAPVFFSFDEQIAMQMSAIARLKDRTALVLTSDMDEPVLIATPTVNRPDLGATIRTLAINYYQIESGFSVPMTLAKEQMKARDADFRSGAALQVLPEATNYRRQISGKSLNAPVAAKSATPPDDIPQPPEG